MATRMSTRKSVPRRSQPEMQEEKKPKPKELLPTQSDEKFSFSFSEEGLTARECAAKMNDFSTKEELYAFVHPDELQRFVSKVFLGQVGPRKCFHCERIYSSSSGFLVHLNKCNTSSEASAQRYRDYPSLWLKVDKKQQKDVLKQIVGTNYQCFGTDCSKTYNSEKMLIDHLDKCIKPPYHSFKNRVAEFRKLDKKTRGSYIREAMLANNGSLTCLVCDRMYQHPHGLAYHFDRCEVEKSEQPWKCYRCGFEATAAASEDHLIECAKDAELKAIAKLDTMFPASLLDDDDPLSKRRRSSNGAKVAENKNGIMLYRYRKSTVHKEFNGVVTKADQKKYENACSAVFDEWKAVSAEIPFCERLQKLEKSQWTCSTMTDDPIFHKFQRKSVAIVPRKVEGLQSSLPMDGVRIEAKKSHQFESTTAAFCGAPINSIAVAPGTMNGDDVICVSTFANETDFESDSSVIQFWRHRTSGEEEEAGDLKLWFLLYIRQHGVVTQATWLQKNAPSEPGLIGYIAFATSIGEVLVYRIDTDSVTDSEDVGVVVAEPSIILRLPAPSESEKQNDEDFLNATIKVEGEDVPVPVKIDETIVPIIRLSWCGQTGGRRMAGIEALGAVCIWDLDEDTVERRIEYEWQSPPTDISWFDSDHVVVAFKEKMVKVFNVNDWEIKLEENTVKTAGTRVHTDFRCVSGYFTFQTEYVTFPFPNAMSLSYVNMEINSRVLVLAPTGNTHQLMTWAMAICPSLGTLVSCGIDGRLVASATGRLLKNGRHSFFANRNVMSLKRRRILKDAPSIADLLKEVKQEGVEQKAETSEKKKEPLEESLYLHDDVCSKMWLEVTFDEPFSPTRPELACRDQRIESLNCVDTNTDRHWPTSFVGGEAGILFAVPSKLLIEETDL